MSLCHAVMLMVLRLPVLLSGCICNQVVPVLNILWLCDADRASRGTDRSSLQAAPHKTPREA